MTSRWFIITGEYPPQPGGVSDYTRVVASALAATGDEVEIWTGPLTGGAVQPASSDGVRVFRTSDHFDHHARVEMGKALDRAPAGTRVLLQYEAWSFGHRGLNFPFAVWLRRRHRRRRDLPFTVMFHEVATDWGWGFHFRKSVHGILTSLMAGLVGRAADRVFMSVPAWGDLLRPLVRGNQTLRWLPVPSNVPRPGDLSRVAKRRELLLESVGRGGSNDLILAHFSTFQGEIPVMLRAIIPQMIASKVPAVLMLVGRGAKRFADTLVKEHPEFASRLIVAGELSLESLSEWLAACDLLVQPYPDGVSSRRTTVMAGLNLGCPIVTNFGHCSDAGLWEESGAVRLVKSLEPREIGDAAVALMENASEREALRERAQLFYDEKFSVARLVEALRGG